MEQEYISEIHKLLKLSKPGFSPVVNGAPEGLPVVAESVQPTQPEQRAKAIPVQNIPDPSGAFISKNIKIVKERTFKLKGLLIYPAIFLAAFAFFYVVLNFNSVVSQIQGFFIKPQAQAILGDQMSDYYKWIKGYYYAVSDPKLLDPTNDINKNGLTNYEKFILHLNPLVDDTAKTGVSDGLKVLNGLNLWGKGPMTQEQKDLVSQLNMIDISNRISYYVASSKAAGVVLGEQKINFDQERPGTLSIPRLKLQVPIIWSKDPSNFDTDLTKGVIHYPGTAMPGENGIIYISGHSSDYYWKRHPYKQIFAKLNYLNPGDEILIDLYDAEGKIHNYRYRVASSNVYKPDDQAQFFDSSAKKLNLSTCWPIGTQKNRLVVTAVQE